MNLNLSRSKTLPMRILISANVHGVCPPGTFTSPYLMKKTIASR